MNKDELAMQLARTAGIPAAEAADQLDDFVHAIVKKLRRGQPATLPGLGKLTPDPRQTIRFFGSKPGSGSPESGTSAAPRSTSDSRPRGKR